MFNYLVDDIYREKDIKQKALYGTEYLIPFMEMNKLRQLEGLFQNLNDRVSAKHFIEICAHFLHFPHEEKEYFVHGLLNYFNQIDMDSNGYLSWSEFTQFLIDNFYHSYQKQQLECLGRVDPNDIINKVHNQQEKHYIYSTNHVDTLSHNGYIKQIRTDEKKRVHFSEVKSNKFKILDLEKGEKELQTYSLPERVFITCFCYSASTGKHCLIGSNMNLYFIDMSLQSPAVCHFYFDLIQSNVWYSEQLKSWLTAGNDGKLRIWKFTSYDQKEIKDNINSQIHQNSKQVLYGHHSLITGVVEMEEPRCLVTCSQDGKLILWDTDSLQQITEVRTWETQVRSLKGIDYSNHFNHYLITYGFETQVRIWCPKMSLSRPFIKSLEGHSGSAVHAKFINPTRYCVTVDERFNIRIWDLLYYSVTQLISGDRFHINDLCFIHDELFVIGGKKLIFFDNSHNNRIKKQLDQDVFATDVLYSRCFDILVVFTKVDTRFYDGRTGYLKMAVNDINQQSKCKCLTSEGKKIFAITERKIEQYTVRHYCRIEANQESIFYRHLIEYRLAVDSTMTFLEKHNVLIIGDAASRITYHHFSQDGKVQLKLITGGHRGSPIVSIVKYANLLIAASKNGIITVYDFSTGMYQDHIELPEDTVYKIHLNNRTLTVKTNDGIWLLGKSLVKLPMANNIEIVADWIFVSDRKGYIRTYSLYKITSLIGVFELPDTEVYIKHLLRRDQLDCYKKLQITKTREEECCIKWLKCMQAHKYYITLLSFEPHQGGLISASTDKTVKVFKIINGCLYLQSTLNLIDESQTTWTFPREVILNEAENVYETLNFIYKLYNNKIRNKQSIVYRIIKKIFVSKHQQVTIEEPPKVTVVRYHPGRDETLHQEIEEIAKSIEQSEKKREFRSKVYRLTKGSCNILQELHKNIDMKKSLKNIDSVKNWYHETRYPRRFLQSAKQTMQNNRINMSRSHRNLREAKKEQLAIFNRYSEFIMAKYIRNFERYSTTFNMSNRCRTAIRHRPYSRSLIKDMKCRDRSQLKGVRFDKQKSRWTALEVDDI